MSCSQFHFSAFRHKAGVHFLASFEVGCDHVTCRGQWNVNRNLSRRFKSQCWGCCGSTYRYGVTGERRAPCQSLPDMCRKWAINSCCVSHGGMCLFWSLWHSLTSLYWTRSFRSFTDIPMIIMICHIWKPLRLVTLFLTSTHLFLLRSILEGNVITTKWNTSIISRNQRENKQSEINCYIISWLTIVIFQSLWVLDLFFVC